jgi:hypothetical protein
MREGDFSAFTGTLINPRTGTPFPVNNVIPPGLFGTVFAWPTGPVQNYSQIFVQKIATTPQAQVANVANTVEGLVSAGTLSPALGQFLSAPLNAALAALGDPRQATGARAVLDSTRDTTSAADLDRRPARAAIRDLEDFILRVRLVVIFGRLRPSEGRILIDLANGIITALRG